MGLARGTPPRVLVVWCPDWPVVAIGTDPAVPAAVVAAGRVVACSAAARAAGVRRMQRVRDAQRHCPSLVVRTRDADAETRAFEPVVTAVEDFCPRVEVVRAGVCAIGTRGPARYFGGEEALAEKITHAVAGQGFTCRAGIADGLFAARLAARAGQAGVVVPRGGTPRFLAPHPVWLLEDQELAGLLSRLGIRTLGDFAALSAKDVIARFGADGEGAHRLARGLDPRPLAPRVPSADLAAEMEFDPPELRAEPVVFAGKALADRLHKNLAGRGLACVRVEIQVGSGDGESYSRLWRHDGLLSSLAVAERVRWQLEGWRTGRWRTGGRGADGRSTDRPSTGGRGADGRSTDRPSTGGRTDRPHTGGPEDDELPRGGVTSLRLVPDQVVPDEGRQLGLWGQALVSDRVARAAAQVQSMLGHEAVTRPVRAGGRCPGDQVAFVPFGDSQTPDLPADRPWPGRIPSPSPVTVYSQPLPASVTGISGEPVTVTGRAAISAPPAWLAIGGAPPLEITAWAGPWPVHEQWWDPARARRLARFQLVSQDGAAWLAVIENGHWVIEASYD
ncbi:MAG: DNA polymerase Y family protein [Micromonosporaceae bacterium]